VNSEGREGPLGDGEKEKLPVWLQIIWPQFWEQKIFKIANIYEKNTSWHKEFPVWYED
jgi:Asp-tRNA(Asn)/Glu-tRNA(Gln) amidotransferase A subunit family amidase